MSIESTVSQINEILPPTQTKDPSDGAFSLEGVRKKPGEALKSLFRFDCVRLSRLFETAQAAVLYSSIVLFLGAGIDRLFQNAYPLKRRDYSEAGGGPPVLSSRQFSTTLLCMLGQVALSCLAVFYVRHVVDVIPFLNLCPSSYISGLGVSEVLSGELSVALVFVGVQTDLLFQLEQLRRFIVGP